MSKNNSNPISSNGIATTTSAASAASAI